jgi:hypothetical protein
MLLQLSTSLTVVRQTLDCVRRQLQRTRSSEILNLLPSSGEGFELVWVRFLQILHFLQSPPYEPRMFLKTGIFDSFLKENPPVSNCMIIRSETVELLHVDRHGEASRRIFTAFRCEDAITWANSDRRCYLFTILFSI